MFVFLIKPYYIGIYAYIVITTIANKAYLYNTFNC
nr:MAG TPA: hypothetical protein [Caudoviricetes sp.]